MTSEGRARGADQADWGQTTRLGRWVAKYETPRERRSAWSRGEEPSRAAAESKGATERVRAAEGGVETCGRGTAPRAGAGSDAIGPAWGDATPTAVPVMARRGQTWRREAATTQPRRQWRRGPRRYVRA